jgi:hypothetical protein
VPPSPQQQQYSQSNEGEPYYILKTNNPFLFWVPDRYDPDNFMPWVHPFASVMKTPLEYYTTPRTIKITPHGQTSTFGLMTSLPVTSLSVTSHPVAILLPVMHNGTFCTTTMVRKKRGNALQGMRRSYFRSREWCHFRSRHFWVSQFLLIHLQTYRQTYIGVVVVVIILDLQLPVQTLPITSKVVSSNSVSSI